MAATEVTVTIAAPIDVVWNVLTEGEHYGDWASGWTAVQGDVEDGNRVTLVGPAGSSRVKVDFGLGDGLGRSMRWSAGMLGITRSQRDFSLTEPDRSSTLLRVSDSAGKDGTAGLQAFVDAVRDESVRRVGL